MDSDKPRRYKVSSKAVREAEGGQDRPRRHKVSPRAAREVENERERREFLRQKQEALKIQKEEHDAWERERRLTRPCKNPCLHERCTPMPFMGYITWTDPLKKPDVFAMKVCCTPDGELATIHMTIPTRDIASIELRPARRPMHDHKGNAEDGIRLANRDAST